MKMTILAACAALAGAADAATGIWQGKGWAAFGEPANWVSGAVPGPKDALKQGNWLFDLGGGKRTVGETIYNGWEDLYNFGVKNGSLTFVRGYASRSNRVCVEKGGKLVFAQGGSWAGGTGMGFDRWEKVSVCAGGKLAFLGEFVPWHATFDVQPGGEMTLAPARASLADSPFRSVVTNAGTLAFPNGIAWNASGKAGGVFEIVQKAGTLKLGGVLAGFPNDSNQHAGRFEILLAGGRVEATGHVACMEFAKCRVAPGAQVELFVAERGSFDLSPFEFGKGAKVVKKGPGSVVVGGGAPPPGLVVEEGGLAYVPFVAKKAPAAPAYTLPDQVKCPYEPRTPVLEADKDGGVAGLEKGFHGRNAGLVRLTGANAIGDESAKEWKGYAWRNESVHGQFVVWAKDPAQRLRASVSPLKTADGKTLPANSVSTRFVRYIVGHATREGEVTQAEQLFGDCLDDAEQLDLPPQGYRPVWFTVRVPAAAEPGFYRGTLTLRVNANDTLEFPLSLTVKGRTLPAPKDWRIFVDFWQHPWAVARYHGVKPFSKLHYAFMELYLKELASLGQKVITATVVDRPWGQGNNYEGFGSMVEVVKRADGTWRYDYSIFDEYVAFAKTCGLGPQIHCYTLAGFKTTYTDEATGETLLSVPAHERKAYWTRFLGDFERHVAAKGWLGDVYLALDESAPEVLKASADLLRAAAPGLKLAMAGERKPSEYAGVEIDNFSEYIGHVTPAFLEEAKGRRAKGLTTSYYICCGPGRPNTFLRSPLNESVWQGLYTVATGIDGILRWAAFTWPRDPLFDGSFIHWSPGDTYLLYPGPRASTRWEMLRDGFEDGEKIRILRAEGKLPPELEKLLDPTTFGSTGEFYAERTAAILTALGAVE